MFFDRVNLDFSTNLSKFPSLHRKLGRAKGADI